MSQPKCSTVTRVPAVDGLEAHGHLGRLVRREGRLPPTEHDPPRGIPHPHVADLEPLAVGPDLDQPLRWLGFERQATVGAIGEPEQLVGLPPLADLTR